MKILIVIGVILVIISVFFERFLNAKFQINRKENKMSTGQKRVQFIGVTIIFIVYLVSISFAILKDEELNIVWILLPFFISLSVFRGLMQWRYNRNANMWISEIFSAVIVLVCTLLLIPLIPVLLN